jgi:hypothetical protein
MRQGVNREQVAMWKASLEMRWEECRRADQIVYLLYRYCERAGQLDAVMR